MERAGEDSVSIETRTRESISLIASSSRTLFSRMSCSAGRIGAFTKVYSGGLRSPLARVQSPRRAFSSVE